jgi:peptidoglycan hydrolase-like protein with peptidoglycan-binding domain
MSRRAVSPEGRTCNALVLAGLGVLLAGGLVRAMRDPAATEVAWFGVALLVLVFVVATRFSRRLMRAAAVVGVVVIALGVVDVGRAATTRARLEAARGTASGLRARLDVLVAPQSTRASGMDPQAAVPASPSSAAAYKAVEELCAAAQGSFPKDVAEADRLCAPSESSQTVAFRSRAPGNRLSVLAARAGLEMARFEHDAATGKSKDALAVEVKAKVAAVARAATGAGGTAPAVDVLDAARAGGREVAGVLPWIAAAGRAPGSEPGLDLGAAGWAIAGALALLWYREVERRAACRALGPVVIKAAGGKAEDLAAQEELFRTYVLRNVPNPGAVPGADALLPVTSLLAAIPAAGIIGTVVNAVVSAASRQHGYTVAFRSITEGAGGSAKDAPRTTIVVRVTDTRTGALVDQHLVRDENATEAVRKAAYWAAAVVLSRSDRVPHWARWPAGTSDALAAHHAADDTRGEPPLDKLVEAVSRVPRNGLLCLKLSHAYALEGRHLDAFELALRAASVDGHYVAARYRLAMTASMVASDVDANWLERPREQRDRVRATLQRYRPGRNRGGELAAALDALAVDMPAVDTPAVDACVRALCTFALGELDDVERLLKPYWVLVSALRRSERSYWLGFINRSDGGISTRRHFVHAVASARPAIQLRRGAGGITEPADLLGDKRTFWQVTYNLACADAVRAQQGQVTRAEDALTRLEAAIERPGSHQLTREWVEADPDLKPLAGLPRFRAFARALQTNRRSDAD